MDGFHITKNSYLNKSSLEERGLLREKKSNPTGDDTPITIFTDIDTGHKIWFTDERLKEMENAKLNDTLYPAPKYDPRKTIPTRDGLLAKLIDKNFDGAEIHRFMQRHNLAEAVVLYPSTSEKTLAEQRESMYIKNKKNLDAAHAEIDRTAHK
jgi:hypothetical protein